MISGKGRVLLAVCIVIFVFIFSQSSYHPDVREKGHFQSFTLAQKEASSQQTPPRSKQDDQSALLLTKAPVAKQETGEKPLKTSADISGQESSDGETENYSERPKATPAPPPKGRLNGVLLLLQGGRWGVDYLLNHNLPRLEQYFLSCFNYPVIIFYENLGKDVKEKISATIPSANDKKGAIFENVEKFWKTLPNGISESQLQSWMNAGDQKKFQGRGYRLMCRFWHGLVWNMEVLDHYEYYWRLDTDAFLTKPVLVDPFATMKKKECQYGFNRLKGDAPGVVIGLWDTFRRWANEEYVDKDAVDAVREFATDKKTGAYTRPMYYNNFELGTIALKRSELYQAFFRYVDQKPPHGILRYRWGDAPLHTLGVWVVLKGEHMCNFTQEDVGYKHAAKKIPPLDEKKCAASEN